MASVRSLFFTGLLALAAAAPARAEPPPAPPTPPADAFGRLHLLRPGDSPESLAREFLGSEGAAPEILLFNRLTREQFLSATNGLAVAIPGPIRLDAARKLEEADRCQADARGRQADRYAGPAFARAQLTLKGAKAARGEAAYDQSIALAALACHQFKTAGIEADRRAPTTVTGRVARAHGPLTARASESTPLAANAPLPPGTALVLGPKTRADLAWPGGPEIRAEQNTRLSVVTARADARVDLRDYEFALEAGALRVRVPADAGTNASVRVKVGPHLCVLASGSEARVEQAPKGPLLLSVYAGQARLGDRVFPAGSAWTELPGVKGVQTTLPAPGESPWQAKSTGDLTPALALPPAPDKGLQRVELARDEHFLDLVQALETPAATATPDLLAPGEYWWRAAPRLPGHPLGDWGKPAALRVHSNLRVTLDVNPAPLALPDGARISALHTLQPRAADPDHSVRGFEYALDDGEFRPLSEVLLLTRPGKQRVRVRGVAEDGARGPEFAAEYRVDNEPPTLRYVLNETTDGKIKVELAATDESGVQSMEVQLGEGEFKPYPELLVVDPRATPVLRVRCTDRVGNISRVRTLDLKNL